MLLSIVKLLYLLVYSVIASQPIFYVLALSRVQKQMRPASYIEMRNLIDKEIEIGLKITYYSLLALSITITALHVMQSDKLYIITSVVSLVTIISDLFLAVKRNVPINSKIREWTPENYPADWYQYRDKWFYYFNLRKTLIIIGFVSAFVGIIF